MKNYLQVQIRQLSAKCPLFLCGVILAIFFLLANFAQATNLVANYFYDGDMSPYSWSSPSIDVDMDGTVAVAVNRRTGAGNAPATGAEICLILMYDSKGEAVGKLTDYPAGMVDITFGPDHRIYTAESWFATGMHIFDAPSMVNRFVPVRFFKGDGGNVDKGGAQSVAVGPDFRMWDYGGHDKKVHVLSPEDKLLLTIDPPAGASPRIDIAPDGSVFMGNQLLQADNTWAPFKYSVADIRLDGKFLIKLPGNKMARYDRAADTIEAEYPLPAGQWADQALGADGNLYLTPSGGRDDGRDIGLAYIVVAPGGEVLLKRGSDYDRLEVSIPDNANYVAGNEVKFTADTISSRLLNYVPKAVILPDDNHPLLALRGWLTPLVADPLAETVWTEVKLARQAVEQTGKATPWAMEVPTDFAGRYRLRFTAGPVIPGLATLQVATEITIKAPVNAAVLTPVTDRNRTGFMPGEAVRISFAASAEQAIDLSPVTCVLQQNGTIIWQAPLGFGQLPAAGKANAVATIPSAITSLLKPGIYQISANALPAGVNGSTITMAIVDPIISSDFITVAHSLMGGGSTRIEDARLHAEMGFLDVVLPMQNSAGTFESYLDVALRLGLRARYQPYLHFAALNSLPEEQGAMRQFYASVAQRYGAYPALVGINYHDLWAPFGTWWDNVRKDREEALWKEKAAGLTAPDSVEANGKAAYLINVARSMMLPPDYAAWGAAIRQVDPRLQCSSQQWWHLDWTYNDPDKASKDMDMVATHHMEEQYYHPITIVNQIEDWRQDGKPTYAYGNCDWQEDGTGGQTFRDLMAALSRGVQGAGRNELATFGSAWTERLYRGVIPALKLSQIYGGISAASQPEDTVAVWRSFYQEAAVPAKAYSYKSAWWQMSTALNTCYYARRSAGVVTDEKVRQGALSKYQALIVSLPRPLPADLLKPLQAFQARGGIVYANRPDDSYQLPAGAVDLGNFFGRSHADPEGNDNLVRWRDMQDEEGGVLATKLREIMGNKVRPLVDCDNNDTWLTVLRSGSSRYICAVNLKLLPQPWEGLHRYMGYENSTFPTKTTIKLNLPAGGTLPTMYDVFTGQLITPKKDGDSWTVEADMSIFPGAIIAMLPQPVASLRMGNAWNDDGSSMRLLVKPVDSKDQSIDGAIPIHVVVTDPAGVVRYDLHRTSIAGQWQEDLPIAANDARGDWKISVQELLAGNQAVATLNITPAALNAVLPAKNPIEWTRLEKTVAALKSAKKIALLVAKNQQESFQPAVDAAQKALIIGGRTVLILDAEDYLAERAAYGWDKFKMGNYAPETALRPKKYDLIVSFDTPALPSKVVAAELLAVKPTALDPGAGQALIQYVTMPVFDTEDGLAISAGDVAGLVMAANALKQPPALPPAKVQKPILIKALKAEVKKAPISGMRQVVGIPIGQVSTTRDGQRIAVAMKGWGNNLFVLKSDGSLLAADTAGKYFPLDMESTATGFWMTSLENDPTCAYWKYYDGSGKSTLRLAANGRRFGGARDWSANHPIVEGDRFRPQASFSISADGRFAAVAGSRGIAVWDVEKQQVLWRDDTVHHTVPLSQKSDVAPNASMFPQVKISPDGSMLVLQHGGKIYFRDGKTGAEKGQQPLPAGATMGRTQVYDGHNLVVGDSDFSAFRDGQPRWHWKAPTDVNAVAFAADGLHYTIGEPNGTVRILKGGSQIGGYLSPKGGIDSLAILPDASLVAFSSSGGQVGVLDQTGKVIWQSNLGTRTQIAFLGTTGETIVGDWRGQVRRYDAAGKEKWLVDLTPKVYRADAATVLTTDDPTPTLRVPSPKPAKDMAPLDPAKKVAIKGITYVSTSGWRGPVSITRNTSALFDGKLDAFPLPWFSTGYGNFNLHTCRDAAYYLGGAPSAPAFDIQLAAPTKVNNLVAYEDLANLNAVPLEIKIEAWVDNNWQIVVHDLWVDEATHMHYFTPVTTDKLRYTVMGDLYHNLWTKEIELYQTN